MKEQVVIIVPIYKSVLNEFERISLLQLKKILGSYEIVFIAPESLIFDYGSLIQSATVIRFEDDFFLSAHTYSLLMLSVEFYKRFLDYEYMLVYQTDAFVFRDDLRYFCNLKYDYIGAPYDDDSVMFYDSGSQVGNGGFSLRNIESCLNLVQDNQELLRSLFFKDIGRYGEDIFFSYCGKRFINGFEIAPVEVAQKFSLESNFHGLMNNFPETIPFGCHNWYKREYFYWKQWIGQYGYVLDVAESDYEADYTASCVRKYLQEINYFIFNNDEEILKKIGEEIRILTKQMNISIRGAGKYGRRVYKILRSLKIPVYKIYDSNFSKNNGLFDLDNREISDCRKMSPAEEDLILICILNGGTKVRIEMEKEGWIYKENVYQLVDILKLIHSVMYRD